MFLVVELCTSRDMVVVPDSWTTSQRSTTWWPPYQSTVQLNKAVHSQEAPGEEWGSHSIRTIHVTDSYNKARRKLAQAKRQSPGTHGAVTLRRSERLKRAFSQHTEAGVVEEGTPQPKRRRTHCNSSSDAPGGDTAVREPPAPPPPARTCHTQLPPPAVIRTRRARLPPPPPPPPATSRRTHRASARKSRHGRPPPSLSSQRLQGILENLQLSLNKLLNVLLCLVAALKKYMMLQEILEKLPDLVERIMDKISRMETVPQMDRIPDIVVHEIMQFVQRETEREEDEEEEEEEEQHSFIREE